MHSKLEVTGLGVDILHCTCHISQGPTASTPNKWQMVFLGLAITTQVIGCKKGRAMCCLCHLIIQNYLDGLSLNSSLTCLFQLTTGHACVVQLFVSLQIDKKGNKKYFMMHLCTKKRTKKLNSTHKDSLNRGSHSARP